MPAYYNFLTPLTVIPVLQGPAGDDVLHQHGVALHEDQLRHQADCLTLQLPDLHVHRAQLGVVAVRFRLLLMLLCAKIPECQRDRAEADKHTLKF